jgi:RNA polymerase sigma-70 factor (ECF subfamily)
MNGTASLVSTLADQVDTESASTRLGDLFDRHHQRLYRLARRLSGSPDEAKDLVQETFLRVARSPRLLPAGVQSEEAWLVRILVNLQRDRVRRSSVRWRSRETLREMQPEDGCLESAVVARAPVQAALARLAPRRRAILVLYELEDVAIPRIAHMLGVSPVTVRWHLVMGRKELAAILKSGAECKEDAS